MTFDSITIISYTIPLWVSLILLPLILWELVWKGIALWKSGRNNQLAWFIFILILNTAGILPIIYLLFFQKKQEAKKVKIKKKKR
jgi:methionyl-tRNA synthetase